MFISFTLRMPSLPKGRNSRTPRSKVQFNAAGDANLKARIPFHGHTTANKEFYSTKEWEVIRTRVLAADPTCPCCMVEGKLVAAKEVDHIQAHGGNADLFYNIENVWGLCTQHHRLKTAYESNGETYDNKSQWLDRLTKSK